MVTPNSMLFSRGQVRTAWTTPTGATRSQPGRCARRLQNDREPPGAGRAGPYCQLINVTEYCARSSGNVTLPSATEYSSVCGSGVSWLGDVTCTDCTCLPSGTRTSTPIWVGTTEKSPVTPMKFV